MSASALVLSRHLVIVSSRLRSCSGTPIISAYLLFDIVVRQRSSFSVLTISENTRFRRANLGRLWAQPLAVLFHVLVGLAQEGLEAVDADLAQALLDSCSIESIWSSITTGG